MVMKNNEHQAQGKALPKFNLKYFIKTNFNELFTN